jgi:hypothetical protein
MRTALEGYVTLMLRDIELSEAEEKSIELDKDDLKEMSAPLASYASKTKWGRKHGREIIAAADSYEALVALGIWMRRVNKIARRHRGEKPPKGIARNLHAHSATGTHSQPAMPQRPVEMPMAPNMGPPVQSAIYAEAERVGANGSSGQSEGQGIRKPQYPPIGYIANPGTG